MIARFEQAPTAEVLEELIGSLPEWFERIESPGLAESFAAWIKHLVAEPYDKSGKKMQRQPRKEGVAELTTLFERVQQWRAERDQEWLQKGIEQGIEQGVEQGVASGIERGIEKGIERGIEQGIESGRVQGERELVHRQVTRRFGPATAEQLLPVLDRLSEPESILAIADAVIECETAEEFLRRVREG